MSARKESANTPNLETKKANELSIIEKELDKFKNNIQKKKKHKLTPIISAPKSLKKNKKRSIMIKLTNDGIDEMENNLHDLYSDNFESSISESSPKNSSIGSVSTPGKLPIVGSTICPSNSVRFVDNIEVITFSRDPSTMTTHEDDPTEEIESLLEDDEGDDLPSEKPNNNLVNYEKTVTTTTTTTTTYQQLRYLSKDGYFGSSPNTTTTEEDDESTESSELNFYQMFDLEDNSKDKHENISETENIVNSMSIKSLNPKEEPTKTTLETEDLVEEIIRVKAVSNVANRHRLLRNYLLKWIHYTTIQKITKDSNLTTKSQRMTKIDAYLKKIREQKKQSKLEDKAQENIPKTNAIVMVKRYQSKLKLQQDIIEVQKLKLERQERMIAELRLSRLSEDAKKFKQDLREELRNAMRTGNVRIRAKAKCLQVVGDVVVEEEESKFVAYGNMIPKFLSKMQERALERQIRHDQAKERRIMLDQEKDAQKLAIEEEKRKADEEAKRQRMLELHEKRKKEKLEKLRKEQEREKFYEDKKKAEAFYRRYLLRRFGMDRLKKVIARKRHLEIKVANLRKRIKIKSCFKAWTCYTRTAWALKYDKAQDYYELYLQRICMRVWRENLLMARGQLMVAVDWHEMKLNEKYFSAWLVRTREAKLAEETKLRHAEAHYKWHVLWKMVSAEDWFVNLFKIVI